MNFIVYLINHWQAWVPVALAALSLLHTQLEAHPRTQALAKLLSHLAGPLNLPAIWSGVVTLAQAIVAADAAKSQASEPPQGGNSSKNTTLPS